MSVCAGCDAMCQCATGCVRMRRGVSERTVPGDTLIYFGIFLFAVFASVEFLFGIRQDKYMLKSLLD